jgi:hypothetical protein
MRRSENHRLMLEQFFSRRAGEVVNAFTNGNS